MKKIFIMLLFLFLLGVASNSCYAEEEFQEMNIQPAEETELLAEAPAPTAEHYKEGSSITDYYPYSEDFVKEYNNVINKEFNGQFPIEDTTPSFKIYLEKGYLNYCDDKIIILKNFSKDEQLMSMIVELLDVLSQEPDERLLKQATNRIIVEIGGEEEQYKLGNLLENTKILMDKEHGIPHETTKILYDKSFDFLIKKIHKPICFTNINRIKQQMEKAGLYTKYEIDELFYSLIKGDLQSETELPELSNKFINEGYMKFIIWAPGYKSYSDYEILNKEQTMSNIIEVVDLMKKYNIDDSSINRVIVYEIIVRKKNVVDTCNIITYLYESKRTKQKDIENLFDSHYYNGNEDIYSVYYEVQKNPKIKNKRKTFIRKVNTQRRKNILKEKTGETLMYTGVGILCIVGAPVVIAFFWCLGSQIGKN